MASSPPLPPLVTIMSSDDASADHSDASVGPLPETRRLTTRRQFYQKLLALSQQNEDLETHLRLAKRSCTQYQETIKLQEALIRKIEIGSHGISCNQLLLEKTRQVAELSVELKTLVGRCNHSHEQDKKETRNTVVDTNTTQSICTSEQTSSKEIGDTQSEITNDRIVLLKKENEEVRRQCKALERSMATLKHKNAEREIRSAKNFRLMQQQMDSVQGERNRRIEAQRTLEDRVAKLEDDNRSNDVEIMKLRTQIEQLRLSQRTQALVFRCDDEIEKRRMLVGSDEDNDLWHEVDGSFPPILVAASRDDDTATASETDSQYDLSDEL